MGYASELGFRASICSTFNFYDIDLETETDLKIHPFAFMDATLLYYKHVKPNEMINSLAPLVEEVKNVQGTLISVWHNESLSNVGIWKNWDNVYENVIKLCLD
jgi:hypothetical protein